jgi:2'-5' RNA ligase
LTFESALVIPVPEAEPVVGDLRTRYDPTAPRGLPAHITVVYPYLHPSALTQSVFNELNAIFTGVAPFQFTLQAFGRFPEVVYLAPDPTEPFLRLTGAVATRWPEAPPYRGIYDELIPHLTVAHTSLPAEVEEVRTKIEPFLPLVCLAGRVWLLTNRQDRWSIHHQFEFGDDGRDPTKVPTVKPSRRNADRGSHGQSPV